jgi:hypothetical protein
MRPLAKVVDLSDLGPHQAAGAAGAQDKLLGRGLEDVSHLFLSRPTADASTRDGAAPSSSRAGMALLQPSAITRERLSGTLMQLDGALEQGLRAFDAKIPCHPCGEIGLLGVDRARQLTIIDFEITFDDGLLLRGIGHFDWIVRNMSNVQRMYREQPVNFSLPPRLFLLAPQFSPLLRSVARHITRPQIHWVRYHAVTASAGPGILFEPVVEE